MEPATDDDDARDALAFLFDTRQVLAHLASPGPWADAVTLAQLLALLGLHSTLASRDQAGAAAVLAADIARGLPVADPRRRDPLLLDDLPRLTSPVTVPLLGESLTMTAVRLARAVRARVQDADELAAAVSDARRVLDAYTTTVAVLASLVLAADSLRADSMGAS